MKHLKLLISTLLMSCTGSLQASALDVVVETTSIKLAAPKGYCPLDKNHPMDSKVLQIMQKAVQSRNQELGAFAPCDRLNAWHEGKTNDIGNIADYQANLKTKAVNFKTKKIIADLCDIFRKQGAALTGTSEREIANNFEAIEEFSGRIQFNSQQLYGVLHEDETGCYAALVQKVQVDEQVETGFTLLAMTVVKQKLLYFYLNSQLTGPSTLTRLLKTSQETIKALLAQN